LIDDKERGELAGMEVKKMKEGMKERHAAKEVVGQETRRQRINGVPHTQ